MSQTSDDGKVVMLGHRGRAAKVSDFQGKALFHLRQYFWAEDRQAYIPTRQGITLDYTEFLNLKKYIVFFDEEFKKLEAKGIQLMKNPKGYQPYLDPQQPGTSSASFHQQVGNVNVSAAEEFERRYKFAKRQHKYETGNGDCVNTDANNNADCKKNY